MALFGKLFGSGGGDPKKLGWIYRYPKTFSVFLVIALCFAIWAVDVLGIVRAETLVWASGVGFLLAFFFIGLLRRIRDRHRQEVTLFSYQRIIFAWPLIAMGFLFPLFRSWGLFDAETLAWSYIVASVIVVLTISVDIGRNLGFFWLVFIAGATFAIKWMKEVKGFTIFTKIYHFFADLHPAYDGHLESFGIAVSVFLAVPYFLTVLMSRIDQRWRVTHNEIQEYSWGRRANAFARGAKTTKTEYPDVLEAIICLAGSLVVLDATGTRVLARIPHIPLLPLIKGRIDRILEVTQVTGALMDEELAASAEVAEGEGDHEHTV